MQIKSTKKVKAGNYFLLLALMLGLSSFNSSCDLFGGINANGNNTGSSDTNTNAVTQPLPAGSLDLSFDPNIGPDGVVYTLTLQPDGKILIGGDFTHVNGVSINRITRLLSNGNLDPAFTPGSGADGSIRTITVQSDGKIFVGGNFTSFNGIGLNYMTRLQSNGNLDPDFTPLAGPHGIYTSYSPGVYTSFQQSDGKIVFAGNFDYYQYSTNVRGMINRIYTNASQDPSFDSDPGVDSGNVVNQSILLPNGDILICGEINFYNSYYGAIGIVKILGSTGLPDTGFTPGLSWINAMALQSNGKIIISGSFTNYWGTNRNYIARLNSNGTLDPSFDAGTNPQESITTMAVQNDGKILVGGTFTNFGGYNYLVRLNSNGSLDTNFNTGTGPNDSVRKIVIDSAGKILIAGDFTLYNGTNMDHIARINP